jgi:hypothetical protein
LDDSGKANIVNSISGNINLEDEIARDNEGVLPLEVKDAVKIDVLTEIEASMIDLIKLNQVSFVISVDVQILYVNDTEKLALAALGVDRED